MFSSKDSRHLVSGSPFAERVAGSSQLMPSNLAPFSFDRDLSLPTNLALGHQIYCEEHACRLFLLSYALTEKDINSISSCLQYTDWPSARSMRPRSHSSSSTAALWVPATVPHRGGTDLHYRESTIQHSMKVFLSGTHRYRCGGCCAARSVYLQWLRGKRVGGVSANSVSGSEES